jgi:hypothetical protein
MKTIEINLYKFEELSKKGKRVALDAHHPDTQWFYEDAHESVKAFHEVFESKEGNGSWLFAYVYYDDDIMNLRGQRLRTWILNNYGKYLFKPKYIGCLKKNTISLHPRIDSKKLRNGNVFNPYHSAIQETADCTLTGVCYDNALLREIYSFIEEPDDRDIKELILEGFNNLDAELTSETEYRNSDEGKEEEMDELDFTEDGKLY